MTDDDEDDPNSKPSTYLAQQALIDPEPRGRFARHSPAYVVGSEPTVKPLATPTWSPDPSGDEPPLGYSIEHDHQDQPPLEDATMGASSEAEGMAEDVGLALLPSDAMSEASGVGDASTLNADGEPPAPTYLGTLSGLGRRRDFHVVKDER